MKRQSMQIMIGAAVVLLLQTFSMPSMAQSIADYTAMPIFTGTAVPPNILLVLDNSGSMNNVAYDSAFDPNRIYHGLFDPLECYDYGSNKFIPDPNANPTSPGTCSNGTYLWSGNLLNYVSMRRIDIAKWVMMGGTCSVGGRDAQGGCRQLIGQNTFDNGACCLDQTQSIDATLVQGRMPGSLIPSGSGAKVNFHLMGSISSLKGSFCVDNDSNQPGGSSCSDSDSYGETQWQIRVDIFENATGIIQEVGKKARFGLMEFKGSGDGGKVLADVGGSVLSMVTAIESTTPSTWTPLAESLYEATRYFAQIQPAYTNSDYSYNTTSRDPYYFQQPQWADTSQYVNCCKSFVIIFTDGEPTQDLNIPSALQDYAHSIHGAHCTSGAVTSPCTPHKTNYENNGTHYLDDVAYYAHTTDLRQATLPVLGVAGKDIPGMQNLTVYTFYAFGQPIGREILQSAAKAGGFEDRNGNNIPDLQEEWDRVNNLTGEIGPDGIPDTYYESSNADELRGRLMATITSILQRSASGTSVSVLATSSTGEGSLYQAYFYPLIYEGLNQITWTGYLQGLFIDALGNLREDTDGDGRLVLEKDVIVKTRYDAATGDVKADRYRDSNGDGAADETCSGTGENVTCEDPVPFESVSLRELKPIWEAGRQLALRDIDSTPRNLLTWVDADNDGLVGSGEVIAFNQSNAARLAPYLRAETSSVYTAANIVSFIEGRQVSGMRDREVTVAGTTGPKVWRLGDLVHSTPTVVGPPKERFDVIYGDSSYTEFFLHYKNRRQVAYVGANDGMLHAFNGGFYHRGDDPTTTDVIEHGYFTKAPTDNSSGPALGHELWGFIPYQLLPHLRWLTQSDYTHVYYVDLKPKVTDVRIFTPDADHPNGWGTILIGGFRLGGSCGNCVAGTGAPPMTVTADFGKGTETRTFYSAYFVLDITNPEKDPVLLWSYSNTNMGLTTSYPAVLRVNPTGDAKTSSTNARWYAVFGSGVTGYDGSSRQLGRVFAVDLKTGPKDPGTGFSLVTTFSMSETACGSSTGQGCAAVGDLISLDADLDYRTDTLYFGNLVGNGNSTPSWYGKLYRLTTPSCASGVCTTATWGGTPRAPTILLATFPSSGSTNVGPITSAPTVTADETGKIWVFFGTGRYYSNNDKSNTNTQYFFGVKDPVPLGGCTQSTVTSCERRNLVDVSNAVVCMVCASGTNQVTGVAGVTTFSGTGTTSLEGLVQSMDGWYTTLPTSGERSVSSPTIIGGTVFFTSFIPVNDICVSSGAGYLYALYYKTGSAYKESVIGTYSSGENTNVKRSISLGVGLPSQMAVQIGGQGSGASGTSQGAGCMGRITGFIQASTGALNQFCGKPALSSWSRYISWMNQRL